MVQAVSICLDSFDRLSIWTLSPMFLWKSKTSIRCCNMSWTWKKIHTSQFQSWMVTSKSSAIHTRHKSQSLQLKSCKDLTALQIRLNSASCRSPGPTWGQFARWRQMFEHSFCAHMEREERWYWQCDLAEEKQVGGKRVHLVATWPWSLIFTGFIQHCYQDSSNLFSGFEGASRHPDAGNRCERCFLDSGARAANESQVHCSRWDFDLIQPWQSSARTTWW